MSRSSRPSRCLPPRHRCRSPGAASMNALDPADPHASIGWLRWHQRPRQGPIRRDEHMRANAALEAHRDSQVHHSAIELRIRLRTGVNRLHAAACSPGGRSLVARIRVHAQHRMAVRLDGGRSTNSLKFRKCSLGKRSSRAPLNPKAESSTSRSEIFFLSHHPAAKQVAATTQRPWFRSRT